MYLKELKNEGSTKEESLELIRLAQAGDEFARAKLVNNYLLLVVKIAREYLNMGVPLADLISEGNVGLLTAVDKFDPSRSAPFSTCARLWIKASIVRNCMHKKSIVRLPENISELMRTDRWTGIPYRQISIDSPNDEGDTMSDDIPDQTVTGPFQDEEEILMKKRVEKVLSFLSKRDAEVVKAVFGIDAEDALEVKEVAEQFNLSSTRIFQILRSSMKVMKEAASDFEILYKPRELKREEPSLEVEIVTALYGANEKFVDVTEIVSKTIRAGKKVRINNKLAGDPCYGIPKKLTVTYIVGENLFTQAFSEGTILKF